MLNFIRRALLAFQPPAASPRGTEARALLDDQDVVARFSTGNIRLQRGEFSTREDLDREYAEALACTFDNAN